jgi:hypothetical protein
MTAQEKYNELLRAVFNFLHDADQHTTTSRMPTGGDMFLPSVLIEFADLRLWTDFHHVEATAPEYESAHDYGQKLFAHYNKLSQLLYDAMERKDI